MSCPFPTGPSYVIVLFSVVSDTSASVCSLACPSLIVIAPSIVWVGAAFGWATRAIGSGASIRVSISA